jgi:hypothetical protein
VAPASRPRWPTWRKLPVQSRAVVGVEAQDGGGERLNPI